MRPLVIIESPYNGTPEEIQRNVEYARKCCRDSYDKGEFPFASHLFFPQFLNEENEERAFGIQFGYEFWKIATRVIFYCDLGWSPGMYAAKAKMELLDMNGAYRYLR